MRLRVRLMMTVMIPATLVILTGCGSQHASTQAVSDRSTNDSNSRTWLAVGDQITAARQSNSDMDTAVPPVMSAPVDVTQPGTYDIVAGPVPATASRRDVAFTLPPDALRDFTITGEPLRDMHFIQRGSQIYIDLPLVVGKVTYEYDGLTVWFQ